MSDINHTTRLHALCSASGSERWIACPGSVGLSLQVPEPPTSSAAAEGTQAHELSELILNRWISDNFELDQEWLESVRQTNSEEMFEHVMTYVAECVREVEAFDSHPSIRIEQRLVFNDDMQMFGTADFLATGTIDGFMSGVIVDLKYGRGKKVQTIDNPQLAYYACALKKCSKKPLERIKVKVVQPRMNHLGGEQWYSREEIEHWDLKLTLAAERALMMAGGAKTPEYQDGSWCWFCPGKSICPRVQEKMAEKILDLFPD